MSEQWTEKVAPKTENAPDAPRMSEENFLAAVRQEMQWEAEAEAEIAEDANTLFEHLFGKDEKTDALITQGAKEAGALGNAMMDAILSSEEK